MPSAVGVLLRANFMCWSCLRLSCDLRIFLLFEIISSNLAFIFYFCFWFAGYSACKLRPAQNIVFESVCIRSYCIQFV